jgi:Fe-S-cluster containining protein
MNQPLQTNLAAIKEISEQKEEENDRFRAFLKLQDGEKLDEKVNQLNEAISPQIDCTACGNCCKTLMIVVEEEEADNLSSHLQQTREIFDGKYLEKGSNGMMLINQMPCHFLSENKCTVYENRFAGCREFPAMHLPNFKERLFTTFMHYERCPIIFNVVEELKKEIGFNKLSILL